MRFMMFFDLNNLLDLKCGMVLTIFQGRYGDGIVTVLTTDSKYGNMLEDTFSDGDDLWANAKFPLVDTQWYPIVFTETVEEAIPAMKAKLKDIETKNYYLPSWCTCCTKACEFISKRITDEIYKLKPEVKL
jgi:hypothetical protein